MVEFRRKIFRLYKITHKEEEEEDYISLLPDDLLIDIISRLPHTKEAIRTSTLSKRWQHLWPYVSNLVFINFYYPKYMQFVSFVDKTLTQCRRPNLHKFQIRTLYSSYGVQFESLVRKWMRYVVSCNVQHLDLYLPEFVLDQYMFVNSCFTHLKLYKCGFNPTCAISWSNLKSFSITDVNTLTEDLIQNLLSGSPLLETLELKNCHGFRRIDITSESVKNLVFSGYVDLQKPYHKHSSDIIIQINAPFVVSLTIAGGLWLSKLLLVDATRLAKAHLDYEHHGYFDPTRKETLKGLMLSLRHVKELTLGKKCLEVLSRLEAKVFIFPSNLKVVDDTSPLSYDTNSDSLELSKMVR